MRYVIQICRNFECRATAPMKWHKNLLFLDCCRTTRAGMSLRIMVKSDRSGGLVEERASYKETPGFKSRCRGIPAGFFANAYRGPLAWFACRKGSYRDNVRSLWLPLAPQQTALLKGTRGGCRRQNSAAAGRLQVKRVHS